MAKRPELSKGELTVARAVWQLREASVGKVYEQLSRASEMDYSTVQTYLRRLEAKGYLRTKRDGRTKLYSAKVQAKQVIRETVRDLIGRLFDGEVIAMVNHLVRDQGLSQSDLQELRAVLADLEGPGDEN